MKGKPTTPPAERVLRALETLTAELAQHGLPGTALLGVAAGRLTSVLDVWTRAEALGWPALTGGRSFFIRGGPHDWQEFLDNAGSEERERAILGLGHLRERQSEG